MVLIVHTDPGEADQAVTFLNHDTKRQPVAIMLHVHCAGVIVTRK